MAVNVRMNGERLWNGLRVAGWVAAGFILLLPLVAMQFTREVDWGLADFLVMGIMLGGAGLALELATKASPSPAYRFASALAVAAGFLLVWVNLAVGFLGDEGNPANLMFAGVIGVAVISSIAARFRPGGMAVAMLAAAGAQLLAGFIGLAAGWASPGDRGLYEVVLGTCLFTPMWLLSAWLFRKAA